MVFLTSGNPSAPWLQPAFSRSGHEGKPAPNHRTITPAAPGRSGRSGRLQKAWPSSALMRDLRAVRSDWPCRHEGEWRAGKRALPAPRPPPAWYLTFFRGEFARAPSRPDLDRQRPVRLNLWDFGGQDITGPWTQMVQRFGWSVGAAVAIGAELPGRNAARRSCG